VGTIKLKICTLLVYLIIFSNILFCLKTNECKAEENPYILSIEGDPTYQLTKTFEKNGKILGKSFKIDIILCNAGNSKSDEIEINLTDQEGILLSQRTFLEAGETKTITFNWSTINIINQNLRVSYYPSDLDTIWNKFNSGHKTFKIKVVDDSMTGTSTPGFEIILMLIAICCISYLFRKKH
jgi:hypothetical protein